MVHVAGDSGFIDWANGVDTDMAADAAALAAHLADTVDAHDATAVSFSPAQGIAATTVQAAIEEVVTDASATYQSATVIQGAGVDPTGVSDSTTAIQALLDTLAAGESAYFPAGTFLISAPLTLGTAGVTVFGPGTIKMKAATSARMVTVSAAGVTVGPGLVFDGNIANQTGGTDDRDQVLVSSTSRALVFGCQFKDSIGNAVTIANSSDCKVAFNDIRNVRNGVFVGGLGADRNLVALNRIDGTTTQNGIFLTASPTSIATVDYVYDNIVTGNLCRNIADSGIETGIHTVNTLVQGNRVEVDANPGILLRDCLRVTVQGNDVQLTGTVVSDGIAVIPQVEAASFNVDSLIVGNRVSGDVTRAAIYASQDGVRVHDNLVEYTAVAIGANGLNCKGTGILTDANDDISIKRNTVTGFINAIDLNYATTAQSAARVQVEENVIDQCHTAISWYQITLSDSTIRNNRISRFKTAAFQRTSASGSTSTFVDGNEFLAQGYTPAAFDYYLDPDYITAKDEQVTTGTVPVTQFDAVTLLPAGSRFTRGKIVFGTTGQQWIAFTKNGATITVEASSTDLTYSGFAGFDDWAIGLDGSNNLILTRRGANTASVGSFTFAYSYV